MLASVALTASMVANYPQYSRPSRLLFLNCSPAAKTAESAYFFLFVLGPAHAFALSNRASTCMRRAASDCHRSVRSSNCTRGAETAPAHLPYCHTACLLIWRVRRLAKAAPAYVETMKGFRNFAKGIGGAVLRSGDGM